MNISKFFTFFLFIFLIGKETNGQSLNWIKSYEQNGLIISYDIQNCNGKLTMFLRLENKGTVSRRIELNGNIQEGGYNQNVKGTYYLNPSSIQLMQCGDPVTPNACCIQLIYPFVKPTVILQVK